MRRAEVGQVRTVFDDVFRVDEATVSYEMADGAMSVPARRLSLERGDSAAAVVVDTDRDTVLLVRQFRYPTWEKGPGWVLELVAGNVERDESPAACIRRELLEEAGVAAGEVAHLATFYTSPGGSSERIHLFHVEIGASGRVGPGGGNPEEQEDVEIVEVPRARVAALLADGSVEDAKTLVGLMALMRRDGGRDDR